LTGKNGKYGQNMIAFAGTGFILDVCLFFTWPAFKTPG